MTCGKLRWQKKQAAVCPAVDALKPRDDERPLQPCDEDDGSPKLLLPPLREAVATLAWMTGTRSEWHRPQASRTIRCVSTECPTRDTPPD